MAAYVRRVRIFLYLDVFLLLFCVTSSFEANNKKVPRAKRAAVNHVLAGHLPDSDNKIIGHEDALKPIQDGQHEKGDLKFNNFPEDPHGGVLRKKLVGNARAKSPKNIMLSDQPACKEDIERLCSANSRRNNIQVLHCLQGDLDMEEQVSEDCQHLVWSYKLNLTRDDRFESAGRDVCKVDFEQIEECRTLKEGTGTRIPCMIEHMDSISDNSCHQFLSKMANIVFSDYRLVFHFMENCKDDVQKFKCGRMDNDREKLHEQGKTILCLAGQIAHLSPVCKKQVLRVAELQSDDYHLDRPLYYACRQAREDLCESVQAGGGKVFECLFRKKNDPKVPVECKRMLTMRQQLMAEDVKVEKTFFSACEADMKTYGCFTQGQTTDGDAPRSRILLCLENAMKTDKKVNPECVAEMTEVRRELMEDYKITPEIVDRCDQEIQKLCGGGVDRGGKTLHCLMEHANPRQPHQGQGHDKDNAVFRTQCKGAIEDLLKEADVAEDITVDQVLADACAPILETDCKDMKHSGIISCLMEKIDSDHMTDECEDRLLEIQYFIVRDFKLDPELYKQCHKDAVELCDASEDWYTIDKATADNSPMVFPCLYRHMKNDDDDDKDTPAVSRKCAQQIKRTMRKRAKRIDLEPKIEDSCIQDLGAFCSDLEKYEKGMEIRCLQDNLDSLTDDCQEAIKDFTEDQDEDLDLDTILMKACTPMIKKFCGDFLEHDAEASDVMNCLIEHKRHHEMNEKCAAGVEHHQIIQLKDYRFSHKFKEACKVDVTTHCNGKTKKTDIVVCLSEIVREDLLRDQEARISDSCKKQLRVEVLQRGETIELDPQLKQACLTDIKQLCTKKRTGNAEVIECLRKHQKDLSSECHKLIFKREQDEAVQGADFQLFRDCKTMIKRYCTTSDANDVVDCLKKNRNSADFDTKCRNILMRRVLQETKDYRLNPSLTKACRLDIPKFCKETMATQKNDEELEGKVVNCLKIEFIKKRLSRDCYIEIKSLVKETHLDIHMDPVLMHACQDQIKQYCSKELYEHEKQSNSDNLEYLPSDTGDRVEECLEQKMMEGKVMQTSPCGREISRIIEEAHVDVHLDTPLYTACMSDLAHFCSEIPQGEGKKMSCLLATLEEFPDKLKPKCNSMLAQRKTLWEYAAKYAPAESLSDLGTQIMQSNSKTYLLGVLMTIVGIIFIVGITCGRVTKRMTRENKMK